MIILWRHDVVDELMTLMSWWCADDKKHNSAVDVVTEMSDAADDRWHRVLWLAVRHLSAACWTTQVIVYIWQPCCLRQTRALCSLIACSLVRYWNFKHDSLKMNKPILMSMHKWDTRQKCQIWALEVEGQSKTKPKIDMAAWRRHRS